MKVLITGSRNWSDKNRIKEELLKINNSYQNEEIILLSGNCSGADSIAEEYAEELNWIVKRFPANWKAFGRYAGPKRNQEMVNEKPKICLAFPIGASIGTRGCIKMALKAGVEVKIFEG